MRHDHDRGSLFSRERQKEVEHRRRGLFVEVSRRFVGEYAVGIGHDRAGDGDALPFAARELRRRVILAVRKADGGEKLSGALPRLLLREAANPKRHRHVVERREFGKKMMKLVHEPEVGVAQSSPGVRREARHRFARHGHLARVDRIESAERVQKGGLPRPRSSENRHGFAAVHGEVHAAEHGDRRRVVAVALFDAPRLQHHIFLIHSARPPQGGFAPRASSDRPWRRGSRGRKRPRSARCRSCADRTASTR